MRADDVKTRRSSQVRRAKMLLVAHVGWLGGYPDLASGGRGIAWRGRPDRIDKIDRGVLAATTRALHELHRDFAAVLPDVVDDVAAWERGVAAAIDALKAAVHDHAALPALWAAYPSGVRTLAAKLADHAALAPLHHALSWIRLGEPRAATADLKWVSANADALAAIADLERILALRRVAEADGDARAAPLVALLADPTLAEVATLPRDYVKQLIGWLGSDHKRPAAPPPAYRDGPRDLATWICSEPDDTVRRNALRALAIVDFPALRRRWRDYWAEVEVQHARGARAKKRGGAAFTELGLAISELMSLVHRAPPAFDGKWVTSSLERFARSARPEAFDIIAAMPTGDGATHPIGVLEAFDRSGYEPVAVTGWYTLIVGYLAARRGEPARAWIEPVLSLLGGGSDPFWELEDLLPRAADWRQLRDALIAATRAGLELDRAELGWFAAVVAASGSPADAIARVAALGRPRHVGNLASGTIATILSEDPDAPIAERAALFARCTRALRQLSDAAMDDHSDTAIVEVVRSAAPRARVILRGMLDGDRRQALYDAASALQTARLLGGKPPRLDVRLADVPAWAQLYPEDLHAALALADVAGLADTARRRLDELFVDPAKLAIEVAAIDARLPSVTGAAHTRLAARRANLAARIAAPPPPKPAKLRKLADELTEAAHVAIFDAWRAALHAHAAAALPRATGVDAASATWLLSPQHRPLVAGIVKLEGADRALALRVIAARAGAPPWDLRDAAPNRAFVAKLTARGLDMAPWVDGIGEERAGDLVLALEDDPIEVLHMGRHFGTCLSPGSENFYSAVVNAADINKRVVYGRVDGKVVGRCLIALTDAGGIVTFLPYGHRREFEAALRAFVQTLARRMGTTLVSGGSIRPLLHGRWYDDGARDLTGRFAFLADGSKLRNRLASIPPDELVGALTEAFAPLPLGGYALGLILNLDELITRPELVVPLAPLIAHADDLPLAQRERSVYLLRRVGREDLIDPRLADHLEHALRAGWEHNRWLPHGYLSQLAELAPARALAVFRDTRPRRARDELNEHLIPDRLLGGALALERLGRPRQAIELYQQVAAQTDWRDLAVQAKQRISALEAQLGARRAGAGG